MFRQPGRIGRVALPLSGAESHSSEQADVCFGSRQKLMNVVFGILVEYPRERDICGGLKGGANSKPEHWSVNEPMQKVLGARRCMVNRQVGIDITSSVPRVVIKVRKLD